MFAVLSGDRICTTQKATPHTAVHAVHRLNLPSDNNSRRITRDEAQTSNTEIKIGKSNSMNHMRVTRRGWPRNLPRCETAGFILNTSNGLIAGVAWF